MNQWQKQHILDNLPFLVENIRCHTTLLSNLCKHEVLHFREASKLSTPGVWVGEEEKTNSLLQILLTRQNGYEHLAKALYNSKQTAALLTLLSGVQDNFTRYGPFAFCNIDVSSAEILSKIVDFEGVHLPLSQVCKSINYQHLRKLIKHNLCATSYENFISNDVATFVRKTVPEPPPYNMQRSFYMNNQLQIKIFKDLDDDIFLIENIYFLELTQLVRQNIPSSDEISVQKSSSQVHRPTARFILLEHPDHFYQIARKNTANCHWIKHKNGSYYYAKSNNGKGTQKIKKFIAPTRNAILSQAVFIEQIINDSSNSPVILCDSPGMGKSVILSEIARSIKKQQPQRNVIFFPLTQLVRLLRETEKEYSSESFQEIMLEVTTTSKFSHGILKKLFKQKGHRIELFLDGLDEVRKEETENVRMLLADIITKLKDVRIFITTRLHHSNDLEEIFGSLGHKILPFSEDDQVEFLMKYWQTKHGIDTTNVVKKIAKSFLAAFPTTDNKITGIPRQCRMLADIFSADAKRGILGCEYRTDLVYQMFKAYMDAKIRYGDTNADMQLCYDYPTKLAIETLYAETLPVLKNESSIDLSKFYKIGILEPSYSDKETPNFVHQTFAEFLAAEFIITCMSRTANQEKVESLFVDLILGKILKLNTKLLEDLVEWDLSWDNDGGQNVTTFHHSMVIHFLNVFLSNQYVKPSLPFKKTLRNSKYFGHIFLLDLLTAALVCNAKSVFIFLIDLYLDLDESSLKTNVPYTGPCPPKKAKTFITEFLSLEDGDRLVTIASLFSSPALVEISYKFLLHLSGNHFDEIQFKNPIKYALYRGSYQIVEYLVHLSKLHLGSDHIKYCLEFSFQQEPAVIKEKIQIVELILNEKNDLKNDFFSGYETHFDQLKYMIDRGLDVTKTNKDKENIGHQIAEYFSAEEFHEFVEIMIGKGHFKLFTVKNTDKETPIHRALKYIEVKSETLDLLAERCEVNFNDSSAKFGGELAYSILGERSERVLKDLIRLGADWKNKENFHGEIVLSFSVMWNSIEAFKFFLSLGANPNQKSIDPRATLLSHAIEKSDYPMEFNKILADHTADQNKNNV